jgi:uncharacterized protein YciI
MRTIFTLVICIVSSALFAQSTKYTFVFLHKNPDAAKISTEDSEKLMKGHMANIEALAIEGKLLAAGPFEGGGGIFILNTASKDEADEWLRNDPGVQARRWNVEMLPFTTRVGSVCPVSAPYQMVNYSFVRFDAVVSKSTASTFPQIIRKHDEYLKKLVETGNVISEGTFGDADGGIIIMKGDVQREIFESDPGVQEGLIELTIRKLYIAKGSFCEE